MPRRADQRRSDRTQVSPKQATTAGADRLERFLALATLGGAVVIPVVVSVRGSAVFREPKQLALYTVAIVVAAVAAVALLLKPTLLGEVRRRLALPGTIALAGAAWAAIAAVFSTHRSLSAEALVYVYSLLVITLASIFALRHVEVRWVALAVFVPASINLAVMLLQTLEVWNPWVFPDALSARFRRNALLGNPNDLGAYFVAPILFAMTLAFTSRRFRPMYAMLAVAFGAGLVLTETLTTIVSTVAAVVVLALWHQRARGQLARGLVVSVVVIAIATIVTLSYGPVRERVSRRLVSTSSDQIDRMLNGRLGAFVSAWKMFVNDPVTGVGPGAFNFEYLPYRLAVEREHAALFAADFAVFNFGEVHNDHLQLLAESGLPGYLLFVAGLLAVGAVGVRRSESASERAATARLLAVPLCCGLAVTMLAGFPLQLAAPAYTFAILGAACMAWDGAEDVA